VPVDVHTRLLDHNDHQAAHLREHFARHGVTAINLMGSPGAGKTALLEATARRLDERLAAVSGDLATDRDAERLRAAGIPSWAITTGSACHLDADMVHDALHGALGEAVRGAAFFFIENVGNLVCPAIYDLGQRANVVAVSVTEGDDKPLKYPVIFARADLVLLTKTDLVPHLPGWSTERFRDALGHVMPEPRLIEVSALTGAGIDGWVEALRGWRGAA
jgi:hydrogenase nickel incorporation protein HypB